MICGLVDYGRGNLCSVEKALHKSGVNVKRLTQPEDFLEIDLVVFPGQGHFGEAIQRMTALGMVDSVKQWLVDDKPFLGICLGFQLLFASSEESPEEGLGWIPGKVVKFSTDVGKVPHMGWNQVEFLERKHALFNSSNGSCSLPYFFHVHSYYPTEVPEEFVACRTSYGISFVSGVQKGNAYAYQFHPEKSQENGLKLLENFVSRFAA
ncbi:MAG: imidazole glycerol phosphate synthase subunit HisH [Verrucomicrobiota bacterium]